MQRKSGWVTAAKAVYKGCNANVRTQQVWKDEDEIYTQVNLNKK